MNEIFKNEIKEYKYDNLIKELEYQVKAETKK